MNRIDRSAVVGRTIGLVGFGHLGRSLAISLVANGFLKENFLVSHGNSERTAAALDRLGFASCRVGTEELMRRADVIFVAVRPQDVLSLPFAALGKSSHVVSCMAGLPLALLRAILEESGSACVEVGRMMCSGPDTLLAGRGVATLYPSDACLECLLRTMGLWVFPVASEEELDAFTVGICIPAILLNAHVPHGEAETAMRGMREFFPVYGHLWPWIEEALPKGETQGKETLLAGVATKGGVTEAMVAHLAAGGSFGEALWRGLERGREMAAAVERDVLAAVKLAG